MFGREYISQTNIQYSKSQIVGNLDTVNQNGSLKIVFKEDNVSKLIDIANSSICFQLNISANGKPVGDAASEPMVLGHSSADIFSITSIYLNGIQLNMT
jgi:hypothetical protein